jgi:uncharacterized protein (TIGR02145 family)
MKNLNLSLITILTFLFVRCNFNNDNILIDGSVVPCDTVKICSQVWMTKNLDVDHYRNGDIIPEIRDSAEWESLTIGAWCYYNNEPEMGKIYGKLYNWYAVNDSRGLAPEGWHIPSEEEWNILQNCLGGTDVAGGEMKAICSNLWKYSNEGGTNESGFYALPGGYNTDKGISVGIGVFGRWWSSTELDAFTAKYIGLKYNEFSVYNSYNFKLIGFSVRCIKD